VVLRKRRFGVLLIWRNCRWKASKQRRPEEEKASKVWPLKGGEQGMGCSANRTFDPADAKPFGFITPFNASDIIPMNFQAE
jgi:hypothetical protein